MAVKTQNRKTLNFTTIHKRISEQGKIISELAPEYSMTEDAFIQEMKSGLGPKVFAALKKMSEKNEKAREKLKDSAAKKRKNNQRLMENKRSEEIPCNASTNIQESVIQITPTTSTTESSQDSDFEHILIAKKSIESTIQSWDSAIESSKNRCKQKAEEVRSAEEEVKNAEMKLKQVKKELTDSENAYQNNLKMKKQQEEKLNEINCQIEKIRQNNIYLVAPGYHGKLPEYGRFISTELIQGIENLEIQTGEVLFNDENLSDMMACGYYDVREYMRAIEFAKVCIAFMTEYSHCTILIDDEKISKVLKTQELEI